ncbi:capsule biosynthesis GfcC family protein [Luteimonas terrae]|uniref:Uncharacterized protein n=1 Tax=Luteimonas terrae TaxID=1530191 RepID=A0A4R5U8T3_9GAMM|nr:capsule biosynthesis GfcC family protein [Luteimonas terrae]TDK30886.1 hypothetical protein E2F49_11135 [Luteimonas terrae]
MTRALLLFCLLATATCAHAQALRVQIEGAVRTPGIQTHAVGARLADAVIAAMPTDDAYASGAVLTRRSAQQAQIRLKAGLLHDLGVLAASADPALSAQADALASQVYALPVTGRVVTELSPRRLEMSPAANLPLVDGDHVYFPRRPTQVRIVGAVVAPCVVPHAPLDDALAYLSHCPVQGADRDWLFVVQPDGAVQKIGIALWNRSEPQALAPGATLYVPLPARQLRGLSGQFNAEFAAFLATQRPHAFGDSP